jgi:hypothetical protein
MINLFSNKFLSKAALLIITAAWLGTFFNLKKYNSNKLIHGDIVSYYSYLTATFVEHDLALEFMHSPTEDMIKKYWPETALNGGLVIKTSMGLALMYLPFYGLGHLAAMISGSELSGHSTPYYFFLCFGTLVYSFIGLLMLRKLLLRWFNDGVSALVLLSIFIGTNLFYYTVVSPLMPHAYIFFLSVLFLRYAIDWHENASHKNSVLLGIVTGLMILCRPFTILFLLVFFGYGVSGKKSLYGKIKFLLAHFKQVILIVVIIFLIFLPQMIYWKTITDEWLFNSYVDEKFYFNNPHLAETLVGFRKGWLLYTPLMIFSLAGLFFMRRKIPELSIVLPMFVVATVYLISCWWAWWFGGSFGHRGMIDIYALLAFPMAACYTSMLGERKLSRNTTTAVVVVLIGFQIFQTIQFRYGAIHDDGMTREAYFETFMKLRPTDSFREALRKPDYKSAKAGLPEKELRYKRSELQ